MLSLIKKILNIGKSKTKMKYVKMTSLQYNRSVDIELMREFSAVIQTLDHLIDKVQGGKDDEGNRKSTELIPLTKDEISEINTKLTHLRMDCLRDKGRAGFTATQNAIRYLGNLRKGNNQLHVLFIVKGLLETGMSIRGHVVQEVNKSLWKTADNRWVIKKEIIGKRAFFDIYVVIEDQEIFTLRCTRKGDAEGVLRGSRPL